MWFKDSTQIFRQNEMSATDAVAGYITDEKLEENRVVEVITTMLAKNRSKNKKRYNYIPIATICEIVLVDIERKPITKYSDFTFDEKLIITAQLEAAIDNIDWDVMHPNRLKILKSAEEVTFSHKIADNGLFHSGISVVPNYLN